MLKLDFYNHTKRRAPKNLFARLLKTAERVLIKEKKMISAQKFCIETSLIGNALMARINKKYRHKKCPTDVISLSYFRRSRGARFSSASERVSRTFIGEIFICMPYAVKQARKLKHTLNKELQFLFIHGLLHIFGYDHGNKEEFEKMQRLTEEILV
ncbi:rRNA maturation RNase YbeY [Candidatus Peregrinibacteria bacterium]|nr:rRNA maturation RNase YbeY [Candidatus Peregrinibacteria bacterium]